MRHRPSAEELLATLAELLDETLLPALPADLRHQVRVGANLARIVGREIAQPAAVADPTLPADETARWHALVGMVRRDLAVNKPGYDAWEGE